MRLARLPHIATGITAMFAGDRFEDFRNMDRFVPVFRQPGLYAYLNHNLIEAFLLGAAAHIQVEGEWDDDLMKQLAKPGPLQAP